MANHHRQTAESLRQIAEASNSPRCLTDAQREDLRRAASVLCRLEQLKHDLVATAGTEEEGADSLSAELISLLGLHTGS